MKFPFPLRRSTRRHQFCIRANIAGSKLRTTRRLADHGRRAAHCSFYIRIVGTADECDRTSICDNPSGCSQRHSSFPFHCSGIGRLLSWLLARSHVLPDALVAEILSAPRTLPRLRVARHKFTAHRFPFAVPRLRLVRISSLMIR